jgi:hypothetical protein
MVNEVEGKFDTSSVHPWVKYGLAIFSILIFLDNILSGGTLISVIALGIGWFFAGPQCVKWAQQGKHNQTWAFFIGVMFNLVGLLVYWIFFKMKGGSR